MADSGPVRTDNIVYRNVKMHGTAHVPAGGTADIKALDDILMDPDFQAYEESDFWAHIVDDEGTYQYDASGNLIMDQDEGVRIQWTPYGKVRRIQMRGDSVMVEYRYDAIGNRVEKKVSKRDTIENIQKTFYIRDAGGNVLAILEDSIVLEMPLYGSSRLGQYKGGHVEGAQTLGRRQFELVNHLGNVLVVVADNIGGSADTVRSVTLNVNDYYPFGLEMPGRAVSDSVYRYGFNGKEKDDSGEFGNTHYDYGFRIYNPSIGKFLSVDPLTKSYPMLTPYQFASNTPIQAIDLDGLEAVNAMTGKIIDMGSQESLAKLPSSNVSLWQDLFDWENSQAYEKALSNVTDWSFNDAQRMKDASGSEVNTDFYAVTIGKLPPKMTEKDLYKEIRENFGTIMDGNSVADLYVTDQDKWKSSNPSGTIVLFEARSKMDDSPVFASKATDNYWIFTPLSTTLDWEHPLAGHRQFGLTKNDDGTYTFYTRGVDRMFDWEHAAANYFFNSDGDWFFKQGDKLWNYVMDKIVTEINGAGGEAKKTHNFNRRVDWKKDANEGKTN